MVEHNLKLGTREITTRDSTERGKLVMTRRSLSTLDSPCQIICAGIYKDVYLRMGAPPRMWVVPFTARAPDCIGLREGDAISVPHPSLVTKTGEALAPPCHHPELPQGFTTTTKLSNHFFSQAFRHSLREVPSTKAMVS